MMRGEYDGGGLGGDSLEQFASYEDYLDAQVSETDMYYLEDEELARQLVELGYRGSGDTLKRDGSRPGSARSASAARRRRTCPSSSRRRTRT